MLVVVASAALSASAMVLSVLPFFSALSNPSYIHDRAALAWLYDQLGFTSGFDFVVFLGASSIAVIVLANALQFLRVFAVVWFTRMQTHHISRRLLAAYLRQPYEYFLDLNTIWARRPGTGEIPGYEFDKVLGRRLARDVTRNTQLKWSDLI